MKTIPAAPFLLLLLPALPAQNAGDVVLKKDGTSVRGVEIVAFTLGGVKCKRGNDESNIPPHQVVDVRWGNPPEVFASAQTAFARGDFGNARQLFGEAANKSERAVLKTESRFLQGKAAVGAAGGDKSAAAEAAGHLRAWLTEAADNFRVPEAMLLLGRALRLGGLGADAVTALKELDDRATRDGWGPVWSARAKYELAQAQLDQDKALDARGSFQAAGAAADTALGTPSPDEGELRAIKINARVGEGETFIREKEYARAMDFFRTLAAGSDPALAAAGKAGEGEALYLAAAPQKKVDDLRAAQVALALASVADATGADTSAKANYYLGLCLRALGPEREGDTVKARANAYFQIVTRSYPGSRWAAAAKAELAR